MKQHPSDTGISKTGFHFDVAPPDGGATAETDAIMNRMVEKYSTAARGRGTQMANLRAAQAKHQESVIQRVGPANWEKLVEYSRRQRASQYGLAGSAVDPTRSERLLAAKRSARSDSISFMKSVGVNPDEFRRQRHEFAEERQRILRPTPQRQGGLKNVAESKVPGEVLELAKGPGAGGTASHGASTLLHREPPYDGAVWYWGASVYGGKHELPSPYLDRISGSVGMRSVYSNYNAGNADGMSGWVDTAVGAWFKPLEPSLLNIHIAAMCSKAQSEIYLDDEWGWSDSDTVMESYMTVNVANSIGDEDTQFNWDAHRGGNPDDSTSTLEHYPPGSTEYFTVKTTLAVPGGVWSFIKVGTFDWHLTLLNDVSTYQRMRNRWFIKTIVLF